MGSAYLLGGLATGGHTLLYVGAAAPQCHFYSLSVDRIERVAALQPGLVHDTTEMLSPELAEHARKE